MRDCMMSSRHSTPRANDAWEARRGASKNGETREDTSASTNRRATLHHMQSVRQPEACPNLLGNVRQCQFLTVIVLQSGRKMHHEERTLQ